MLEEPIEKICPASKSCECKDENCPCYWYHICEDVHPEDLENPKCTI